MKIIQKIFNVIAMIARNIFIFYLLLSWVIIPLVVPLTVNIVGKKVLKHPVRLSSAQFNPFLWRLTLKNFQITDNGKNKLVGFDRLSVNVSFLSLLKKIYRVESVKLDGLLVHATLKEDGKIDLLGLIPPATEATKVSSPEKTDVTKESPADVKTEKPLSLPNVVIDEIRLTKGKVEVDDKSITPNFKTALSDIDVAIKGISTDAEAQTDFTFKAKLDDKGSLELQAQMKPLKTPLEIDLNFNLDQYALTALKPYVGKYTGRDLADGQFNFKASYRISDEKLTASHKILIQKFEFGKKVESKDALNLPFGLAIALLEDPQGRINISLPAKGDMSDPEFKYTHLIWQVFRNFFVKLVTKPFSVLGSILGADSGTEELGYVRFSPGKTELSPEEKEKILQLVKGLKERPKLILEVNGSFDPEIDWKAIKTDIFEKDYTALSVESVKQDEWVLQTLYQRRFGIRDLWKLTKSFKDKKGNYDNEKMNQEIKRRLIEDAPPDKVAMDFLAQSRAKVVYDEILKDGFDAGRLKLGNLREVQGSMGYVPLEFTLTVFEQGN